MHRPHTTTLKPYHLTALCALLISCNLSGEDDGKRRVTNPPPTADMREADMRSPGLDQQPDMRPLPDMPPTPDMSAPLTPTTDYLRCRQPSDCPAGTGECVKSLNVHRTNPTQQLALSQLLTTLGADEGVCALPCALDPTTCDAIPGSTCQVIYAGAAPQPGDTAAMTLGRPFASLCRPALPQRSASFCAPCLGGDNTCDASEQCISPLTGAPAQANQAGECLVACDPSSPCPLGFNCEQLGQGSYCKPQAGTCSKCLDADGDGRGLGHCPSTTQDSSPYDCDDADPLAYFDPQDPDHPFPAQCAQQDLNCNGISDDVEQIGPDRFPQEHCAACFDDCAGAVANGSLGCVMQDNAPTCIARCDGASSPTHADCDNDPSNGCETPIIDPTRQFYPDLDRDGFGDKRASARFTCGQDALPPDTAWVQNNTDCDDANNTINPNAQELCDGRDNNCDEQIDEGFQVGASCTNGTGECRRTGKYVCDVTGQARCDATPGTPSAELCDGRDNDCDGTRDEGFQVGASCTSGMSRCARQGHYVCAANNQSAVCDATPLPSSAEVCDDIDNDCDNRTDEGCPCTGCTNNNLTPTTGYSALTIGNERYWPTDVLPETKTLTCPTNQFIVGLRVRSVEAIDNVEIECNYLDVTRNTINSTSAPRYLVKERASSPFKVGLIGNTNTNTQSTLNCTSGSAVTRLYSGRGDLPDGALFQFSARCSPVTIEGNLGLAPSAYTVRASGLSDSKTFGSSSLGIALPVESRCPNGEVANAITGYAGRAWVGVIQYPKVVHGLKLKCVKPTITNTL